MTPASGPPSAAVARERRRLAAQLDGGVVQQVTATLALAVDSALLHHADGEAPAVEAALRSVRAAADAAVRDFASWSTGCSEMLDFATPHRHAGRCARSR